MKSDDSTEEMWAWLPGLLIPYHLWLLVQLTAESCSAFDEPMSKATKTKGEANRHRSAVATADVDGSCSSRNHDML